MELFTIFPKHLRVFIRSHPVVLLVVILLLAVPPRLTSLTLLPPPVIDEGANLRDIHHIFQTKPFTPAAPQWDGSQSQLFYYPTITLISMSHMNDFFTLRLTSVILSLLILIPFFFIAKRFMHPAIAAAVTLLFSYSYYFLEFSRVGWSALYPVLVGLFLLLCILKGVEKHRLRYIVSAGILAGLLAYTYQPGIVYSIAAIIFFLLKKPRKKDDFHFLYIFLGLALIISLPVFMRSLLSPSIFFARAQEISIFSVPLPYHGMENMVSIVLYQLKQVILSWIFFLPQSGGGIEDQRYLPLIYSPVTPVLIPFFWIGFYFCCKHLKQWIPFFSIFLLALIIQFITINPPNGARMLVALPIIYLIIGMGFEYLILKFKNPAFVIKLIVFSSFFVAYTDCLYYFYWMSWIQIINR